MEDAASASRASLWRFGTVEFDELRRELRVANQPTVIESKPLEVLLHLLRHAGEVVTKEELLDAVWPGLVVVEGSLPTAVSKLRKAIGDDQQLLIVTVPRIGYRLTAVVQRKAIAAPELAGLALGGGQLVPGRDQWRLVQRLDLAESSEVWRAEHVKTHEARVFKFAGDGLRLRALKREVTLARLLREALGERDHFVRVLEWNFETAPYFVESEYGGVDLIAWAEQQGGLSAVSLQQRLDLLAEIAQAVADAHGAGVLHKDLKPRNVLISATADGRWQVKVADFGSGHLLEADRLDVLSITRLGFTQTEAIDRDPQTGTPLYLAPEVLAGAVPTAAADVYALGVMLYQLCVGDFRRPLTVGWEADVQDSLLRLDISEAANGNVQKRLPACSDLVSRLRNLKTRRQESDSERRALELARLAEERLKRARTRRPWLIAMISALSAGLAITAYLYLRAEAAAREAQAQELAAEAINRFLNDDLIGSADPRFSDSNQLSVVDAVRRAAPRIDQRFSDQPAIAARLRYTIASAFASIGESESAAAEFARACPQLSGDRQIKCSVGRVRVLAKQGHYDEAAHILNSLIPSLGLDSLSPQNQMLFLMADADLAWQRDDNQLAAQKAKLTIQRFRELSPLQTTDDQWKDLGIEARRLSAGILQYCRDLDAARNILQALVPEATQRYGARNGLVIDIRNKEVINLVALRRLDEATPMAIAVVDDARAAFGEGAITTLQAMGNLAYLYNAQTEMAKEKGADMTPLRANQLAAIDLLRVVSSRCIDRMGEPFCAGTVQDLALSLLNAGQFPAAAEQYRRAYEITVRASGGKDAPAGSRVAFLAAEMLLGAEQAQLAKPFLDKVLLKQLQQSMPDYALDCRWPLAWGHYYAATGAYPQAAEQLKAALAAAPRSGEDAYLIKEVGDALQKLPEKYRS